MKNQALSRALYGGLAAAALSVTGIGLSALNPAPAHAASLSTWDALAQCESSGNWSIDTGNGYYGGLQFSMRTWAAYGGTGSPANASKAEQIAVAEKVLAGQGWKAWPACSAKLGLTGGGGGAAAPAAVAARPAPAAVTPAPAAPPAPAARPSAPAPARHAAPVQLSGKTYTVASGDTLAKIAAQLSVPGGWESLADANANIISNPNLIFPGQVLQLPA